MKPLFAWTTLAAVVAAALQPDPPVTDSPAARAPVPNAPAADVPRAVLDAEADRVAVVAKARAAVLAVFGAEGGAGGGSGVVISADGYALTNFHVANPSGYHMRCGMDDGRLYDAVIVGIDPTGDVALIKLLAPEDDPDHRFPHAPLGDSDKVRVGDWSLAMGNPFLLATDFVPTVTYGMISGVHRYQYPAGTLLEYADCIQSDTAINPGNSGGPLFNDRGEVIGIVGRGSFEKRGRVNVGVGYSISINQIKNFMGYLRSGRIVDHATLGATVASDADGRVVVSDILQESDAYRRGLRYDDEIIRFGGRPIRTVNAFKNVLGIYPKGWRVPLVFRREGEVHEVLVRLRGVHRAGQLWDRAENNPTPSPRRGPKDKPSDDPEKDPPLPRIAKLLAPKKKVPRVIRDHYQPRRGFANYYFNKLNRDRVWRAFAAGGDFSPLAGPWSLYAVTPAGEDAELHLTAAQGVAILPAGQSTALLDEQSAPDLKPVGSGGLLLALHCWKRLLTLGPERYGNVYYLGTAPLVRGSRPAEQVDVLVGVYAGVECRFLFDPAGGHLVGMEMHPQDDDDPCEVYFSDYKPVDGRRVPHHVTVRHGDRLFGEYKILRLAMAKEGEP